MDFLWSFISFFWLTITSWLHNCELMSRWNNLSRISWSLYKIRIDFNECRFRTWNLLSYDYVSTLNFWKNILENLVRIRSIWSVVIDSRLTNYIRTCFKRETSWRVIMIAMQCDCSHWKLWIFLLWSISTIGCQKPLCATRFGMLSFSTPPKFSLWL